MKYIVIIVIVFLACPPTLQDSRNFNARHYKAGMIIGQWQTTDGYKLVFSPLGTFLVQSLDGTIAYHRFRVLTENSMTGIAEIELLYNDSSSDLALCTVTLDSLEMNFPQKDSLLKASFVALRSLPK